METYEKLIEIKEIDNAIFEAEKEIKNGVELIDARKAMESLRRK